MFQFDGITDSKNETVVRKPFHKQWISVFHRWFIWCSEWNKNCVSRNGTEQHQCVSCPGIGLHIKWDKTGQV